MGKATSWAAKFGFPFAATAVLGIAGCGSRPTPYPANYKATFEKRVGADEGKARAFVDHLASLPAEQRADYVRQHSADAKNLSEIPDQDLQSRYRNLVRAKQ